VVAAWGGFSCAALVSVQAKKVIRFAGKQFRHFDNLRARNFRFPVHPILHRSIGNTQFLRKSDTAPPFPRPFGLYIREHSITSITPNRVNCTLIIHPYWSNVNPFPEKILPKAGTSLLTDCRGEDIMAQKGGAYMTIPERLVAIREKNGYTRKRLAEELGRPYRTLTNYETGDREPGHEYIIEIAKKFGVTTDYILGTSDSPDPPLGKAPPYSSEALKLAADFDGLDEWGKRLLRTVAENEIARCAATQKGAPKLDISAEMASYRAELELQEEVAGKSLVSDGLNGIGRVKMA
jgi:transcriptional regulator with XRE-family HTH domain